MAFLDPWNQLDHFLKIFPGSLEIVVGEGRVTGFKRGIGLLRLLDGNLA
jgi:hypothetical protein